jgi:hypothetical protein
MALIVEDGTGKPDAESYASVAELRTYCNARGLGTVAALADDRLEVLLRQATDYMLGAYGALWQGERAVVGQALDWPRTGVVAYGQPVADNIVPAKVRDCCSLLAAKANTRPLLPDGKQLARKVKIGPIEKEFDNEYSGQGPAGAIPQYYDAGRLIVAYTEPVNPYEITLQRA